jgi:predicted Zn-dependent protease
VRRGVACLWVAAAALAALPAFAADAVTPDPLLRAMHDEAMRSRQLTVPNLPAPYFVEYVIDQSENFSVSASLGGLLTRRHNEFRIPEVHVRVGDYKFDNTDFAGQTMGGNGYGLGPLPLDNSYALMRRYLWLATDSAYKSAVETLARKRAAVENLSQGETLDDFAHADPLVRIREFRRPTMDENAWTARVRALSTIFADFPQIEDSHVDLESATGGYYVANSEGTEVSEPEDVTYLRVRATIQAKDGSILRDALSIQSLDAERMPADTALSSAVRKMAENLTALAQAPKGEDYTGPVLFEGQAAPQLFAQLLGRNLTLPRKPEGSRGAFLASALEGRLGTRILPESFDVVDDPTQKEWRGRPLFGSYEVDREGVAAKPVSAVEKGMLRGFLLTRQPVRGFSQSNGHARLPGRYGANMATISNLFVSSSETMPASGLKQKLIEMMKARNLPYGVIVRRLDYPSTASIEEVMHMMAASGGSGLPVSPPVLTYKVYPDSHEELVRGLRFRGLTVRSLRDIEATGDDSTVFEFMENPAPMALMGASTFATEACVVAPSVVIDDVELHPSDEDLPKLPVVPAPEITR